MKLSRLAAAFVCSLFLCISNAVAFQQAAGVCAIPTVANSASLPVPGSAGLTKNSSIFCAIPSNCGSVTVGVMLQSGQSSWVGQAHLYTSTGTLGGVAGATVYPRYDQVDGNYGTTAIAANFVGTLTFPVPTGSAGVIITSLTGVPPLIVVLPGPPMSPIKPLVDSNGYAYVNVAGASGGGLATVANQTTQINNQLLQQVLAGLAAKQTIQDGNGNYTYIGFAPFGTLTSATGWYVSKLTYSGTNAYQNTTWATVSGTTATGDTTTWAALTYH